MTECEVCRHELDDERCRTEDCPRFDAAPSGEVELERLRAELAKRDDGAAYAEGMLQWLDENNDQLRKERDTARAHHAEHHEREEKLKREVGSLRIDVEDRTEELESESRWAAQYKKERDEAVAALSGVNEDLAVARLRRDEYGRSLAEFHETGTSVGDGDRLVSASAAAAGYAVKLRESEAALAAKTEELKRITDSQGVCLKCGYLYFSKPTEDDLAVVRRIRALAFEEAARIGAAWTFAAGRSLPAEIRALAPLDPSLVVITKEEYARLVSK